MLHSQGQNGLDMLTGKALIEEKGPSLIESPDANAVSNYEYFSGPYLFVSFDLVDSTSYKSQNLNWPKVFNSFMISCYDNLQKCISRLNKEIVVHEWKRLGDEILFYIEHPSPESLHIIPTDVFDALQFIIAGLKSSKIDRVGQLSAKATLWSAVVSSNNKTKGKNLFNIVTVEDTPYGKRLDFLGPDIDTGFRIAKYASPGKLTIDAYLAWYITKLGKKHDSNIENNMRIVSLENIKGVWNNRRYPIIWYNDKWKDEDDIFLYDEEYSSDIVKRIKENGIESLQKTKALDKILDEVNLLAYAKQLEKSINQYTEKHVTIKKEILLKRT